MQILNTWKQGQSDISVLINETTAMLEVYKDGQFCQSVDDTDENRASFFRA